MSDPGWRRGRDRGGSSRAGRETHRNRGRRQSEGRADGVGGPRFFGQFLFFPSLSWMKKGGRERAPPSLRGLILLPLRPCGLTMRGFARSGHCAVVARAIAPTYGVEASAARAHGSRPRRYVWSRLDSFARSKPPSPLGFFWHACVDPIASMPFCVSFF